MRTAEDIKDTVIQKARCLDWLIAMGLTILFTVIYWLTVSKDPTIDSFVTAYWVKSTAQWNWFHPHHLLFSYACRFVNAVYQTLFPPLDLLMLLTRCMHILGGMVVGLSYLRLYAMRISRPKAATIALLIGTGYGMWFFSTIFEIVMLYFVMFIAAWAAAHRWGRASRGGALGAGAVLGAGVLIHQTLIIYEPAFLIFVFMLGNKQSRWQRMILHLCGCLSVIIISYVAAFQVLGLKFPSDWFNFFTSYAQEEAFTHGTLRDALTSARNMMSMWVYPILYASEISFRFLAAMAVLVAFLSIAIWRTIKKDPFSTLCLFTFAIAFIFFTWWSPATLDFFLIPAVIIALPTLLFIKWRFIPLLFIALAAWLFLFNNLPEIKRHAEPQVNCVLETGRRLKSQLKPDDKVFIVNQPLDACAAYLEMPAECLLVVENLNEEENLEQFSRYAKSANNYAVYYDQSFSELAKSYAVLQSDAELQNLMENARLNVYVRTCSYLLLIWKIQREIKAE